MLDVSRLETAGSIGQFSITKTLAEVSFQNKHSKRLNLSFDWIAKGQPSVKPEGPFSGGFWTFTGNMVRDHTHSSNFQQTKKSAEALFRVSLKN